MGVGDGLAAFTLRIGEQRQRPLRGDARIELTQAARGGVAWIGEDLLPGGGLRFVHLEEVGLGHEDLAADFDQRRRVAFQSRRHRVHRAEVGGDVFTLGAVAARGTAHEAAVLVGQVDRQSIDLRFGDKRQLRACRQPDKASRAGTELAELFRAHCIVERQHRHAMADFCETALRRATHAVGWRVLADQMRKAGLDRGIALAQRVVGRVGDLRRVLLVVQLVVMRDLPRELREFSRGVLFRQVAHIPTVTGAQSRAPSAALRHPADRRPLHARPR